MGQAVWDWIEEVEALTRPKKIVFCDGSKEEQARIIEELVARGEFIPLNREKFPHSYLYRSDPDDVARSAEITYVCTERREDAGPTNQWKDPLEALESAEKRFKRIMRGKAMYVIPYILGPLSSPYANVGIQLTDSLYVVASLQILTRITKAVLEYPDEKIVLGIHAVGDLEPAKRFVYHFPEKKWILSGFSAYGGNALQPKKNHGLRIASWIGKNEGWFAEHMLIAGVGMPDGEIFYFTAAFPSACGKTNLAMLSPSLPGYNILTVSEDLAHIRIKEGVLRAYNPEAGFFAVASGTNWFTNPNMMASIRRDTIFTNVGLTKNNEPWWEGLDEKPPPGVLDWQGRVWIPDAGSVAHKNSRLTVPARHCPSLSSQWEDPEGVPIKMIFFGSRRSNTLPLVFEAFSWEEGIYHAAAMRSERTAATVGRMGELIHDPFAMIDFCGYNMAEYFDHWLQTGCRLKNPPRIFFVNWFRLDQNGKFLWPGFGENIRVLDWAVRRVRGEADAIETPIGWIPTFKSFNLEGIRMTEEKWNKLMIIKTDDWRKELEAIARFFKLFGELMPQGIWKEYEAEKRRFGFL